jgi:PleD family two-component response regulator
LCESRWANRPLTASFGIATSGPTKAAIPAGFAELVEQADAALYFSKQQGRDRITHHDEMPDGMSTVQVASGGFLGSIPS